MLLIDHFVKLLPARMAGRRREGLKFVRPTRLARSLGASRNGVFFFFSFCSSSRCFLESPSAPASSTGHPLAALAFSPAKSIDPCDSVVAAWRRWGRMLDTR